METGDLHLLSRISLLFNGCDSELRRGASANLEAARSDLQAIAELLPQLLASHQLPESVLRDALADLNGRVARCAILLESARTFHRGLAIRTGQAGTSYTAAGLGIDFTYTDAPTALNG
ncbi:MAG: hypothetical protein ABI693_26625 [Bryobacteraceae bacterium]